MRRKKMMAILLSAVMAVSTLAACGSSASTETTAAAEQGNTQRTEISADAPLSDHLTIGCALDPESFNPWLMAHTARQNIYYNSIYEPLARLNAEGEREFVLAKSAEPEGEGCYKIELYDNIFDSEGNHITASDVIFSFDACIEQGALAWGVKYLDHFEQQDDYTLLMYVKDESAVALDMLLKTVFIVSEKAFTESADGFATKPVGTGPYVLKSYTPGSEAVIEVRDAYWQTDAELISTAAKVGSVKTVTFKIITDLQQLALALEMGDIDVSNEITTADLSNFLTDERTPKDGFNSIQILDPLVYFTAFNCGENSVCADINVRKAISYAVDTQAIVTNLYGVDGAACTTSSSPYYGDYDEALNAETAYAYNPEKAKELLAEAGYEKGFTIRGCFSTEGEYAQVASLMQAYLSEVGITLETNIYEPALFNTTKLEEDSWDLYVDCTMGLNTPGRMGILDRNGYTNGSNGVFVVDNKLQSLYETANAAASYGVDSVTDLLNYVNDTDYIYPMYYKYRYVIAGDRVTNMVIDRNNALIPGASTVVDK